MIVNDELGTKWKELVLVLSLSTIAKLMILLLTTHFPKFIAYKASDLMMIVNDELGMKWKELVMVCF
jgi:hypothetical protein